MLIDTDMMSPDAVLKQQQYVTDPETRVNLTINPDHALITTVQMVTSS
jgi:hypothetical protein